MENLLHELQSRFETAKKAYLEIIRNLSREQVNQVEEGINISSPKFKIARKAFLRMKRIEENLQAHSFMESDTEKMAEKRLLKSGVT